MNKTKFKHGPEDNSSGENEFRIKFLDGGETAYVPVSVIDHPLVYDMKLSLGERDSMERAPVGVIMMTIGLPDVEEAFTVFFSTKEKKLCTEAEIAAAVKEGTIQHRVKHGGTVDFKTLPIEVGEYVFTYSVQDGKWNKTKKETNAVPKAVPKQPSTPLDSSTMSGVSKEETEHHSTTTQTGRKSKKPERFEPEMKRVRADIEHPFFLKPAYY